MEGLHATLARAIVGRAVQKEVAIGEADDPLPHDKRTASAAREAEEDDKDEVDELLSSSSSSSSSSLSESVFIDERCRNLEALQQQGDFKAADSTAVIPGIVRPKIAAKATEKEAAAAKKPSVVVLSGAVVAALGRISSAKFCPTPGILTASRQGR